MISTLFAPNTWRFPLLMAIVMAWMVSVSQPAYRGDLVEYTLDTVAIASHGTPDIRLEDIARTRALLGPGFDYPFDQLERGMRAGEPDLYAAFARGKHGDVYPVHFFGYSLLAAAPFKAFDLTGVTPFKAFLVVNLAAMFVLGLALRRFFGCEARAWAGLMLFMLCGGSLYWQWTSPECLSAALLLAALLYFTSGAPMIGAVLAGVASWQNPTILFFFGFAPLLKLCLEWQAGIGLAANVRAQLTRRNIIGLAAGIAVLALPVLFNLVEYGVPNIIARKFSDPSLVGGTRLFSFFFDLNQGMVVGLPGLLATVLLWATTTGARARVILALAVLFLLALAVPALAVLNWNSDAAGMMRYAFWSSMPLVFVLLAVLRGRAWPGIVIASVAALQAGAMVHANGYKYTEFSPLADKVMVQAPTLYHPEPEIFAERAGKHDNYISPEQVYTYRMDGALVKTLVNAANPGADAAVCGAGALIAPDNDVTNSTRGWRYIDGPVRCVAGEFTQRSFQFDDFRAGRLVALSQGWSGLEANGPGWNGAWSDGARSQLVLEVGDLRARQILISGSYLENQGRTRVRVNGVDLGWHQLDREGPLTLPAAASQGPKLTIDLDHESPRSPGASDPRQLAFFLREINLRAMPAPKT